jgi:UDP-3-O-[3-hydroxymyristoyl] glucosamine N-acyltransferase
MYTAAQIAQFLGGRVEGDAQAKIWKPAKIEEGEPGAISFLGNHKYEDYFYTCTSSVILVAEDFLPKRPYSATLIRVKDVYAAVSQLLQQFEQAQRSAQGSGGIHPQAYVHPTAQVAASAQIAPFVYVGEGAQVGEDVVLHAQVYVGDRAVIGAGTVLHSGVKVYRDCLIGARCIVHAGAVIGADGFGFAPQADGSYQKIPHLGIVEVQDEVEIGANTCIDRATMGKTVIETGAKLDNLIQIAHNVVVGAHTVIAAQAAIAGSAKIGRYCMIGGQSGIVGHVQIADGVRIQGQSGIDKSIETPKMAVYGSPALPYTSFLRSYSLFKDLPQLEKRLRKVEAELKREE